MKQQIEHYRTIPNYINTNECKKLQKRKAVNLERTQHVVLSHKLLIKVHIHMQNDKAF